MGHKMCIVTNCNRTVAEYILNYIDIYNIIDKLIIGNECNQPKPSPEPYIVAMTFLNIDNCILIALFSHHDSNLINQLNLINIPEYL